ncbi:glycogen debranching protein GlgX [Salinispirillum marinum]|uniref:Glycogen debranching protein GlgX n=2 Tax=Saccharospirillaceae TaxID=255527 RepID=A0ABV8BB46_9GAMM
MTSTVHAGTAAQPGLPFPLGAQLDNHGCNFAVYSPLASGITLCLYDDQEREINQLPLTTRTGNVWHIYVPGIRAGQAYGYRARGLFKPEEKRFFSRRKLLLDPYAQGLSRAVEYHPSFDTLASEGELQRSPLNSGEAMPKSLVVDHQFDWQDDQPLYTPWTQTIVYETHIRGISQTHPDVPPELRGTYLGMAHPSIIQHLTELGITAVQIMPIHAAMSEPRLQGLGLRNYWGYNPINWFAPDPRYAVADAITEFKTLVRSLHQAGIEVLLDVVYNHTAEAGLDGTTLSQKGLAADRFYRFDGPGTRFINDSGCGNTVNVHQTSTLKMVMDSLRLWVEQYHVDGFRFDLAATLGREARDFSPHAAFFKAVAQDPVLSRTKLIAEPWDIGPNGYQLGQFPDHWYECNDQFRDTVRAFWRGDHGLLPDFCTRLMGSRDRLQKGIRALSTSLNYVTYHDGFTLQDLVSYEHRHNEANKEQNRDGHGHNLSANYGVEGPTNDPAITALRAQQKRNLLATLLLSQGAVHLLGGDEIGRTQRGNNNAYCQDNAISWYDWSQPDLELYRYVQHLIHIRQSSTLFHDLIFSPEQILEEPAQSDAVHWFNSQGEPMSIQDWHNAENQTIGLLLSSTVANLQSELSACAERFIWLINASTKPCAFHFPGHAKLAWQTLLDTRAATPPPVSDEKIRDQYRTEPRTMVLLSQPNALDQ